MEMMKKLLGAVALVGLLSFSAVQCAVGAGEKKVAAEKGARVLRPDQSHGTIAQVGGKLVFNKTGSVDQYGRSFDENARDVRVSFGSRNTNPVPVYVGKSNEFLQGGSSDQMYVSVVGDGLHKNTAVLFDLNAKTVQNPDKRMVRFVDVLSPDTVQIFDNDHNSLGKIKARPVLKK